MFNAVFGDYSILMVARRTRKLIGKRSFSTDNIKTHLKNSLPSLSPEIEESKDSIFWESHYCPDTDTLQFTHLHWLNPDTKEKFTTPILDQDKSQSEVRALVIQNVLFRKPESWMARTRRTIDVRNQRSFEEQEQDPVKVQMIGGQCWIAFSQRMSKGDIPKGVDRIKLYGDITGQFACVRGDTDHFVVIDFNTFKVKIAPKSGLMKTAILHDYYQNIFFVGDLVVIVDTCGNMLVEKMSFQEREFQH